MSRRTRVRLFTSFTNKHVNTFFVRSFDHSDRKSAYLYVGCYCKVPTAAPISLSACTVDGPRQTMTLFGLLIFLCSIAAEPVTSAFSLVTNHRHNGMHSSRPHRYTFSSTQMHSKNPQSEGGPLSFVELTSTLTKWNDSWENQQRKKKNVNQWKKIALPTAKKEFVVNSNVPPVDLVSGAAVAEAVSTLAAAALTPEEYCYLLEPRNLPSCVIVFLGGAGLGQFPQVAYDALLGELSNRLNAAILTTPYSVGLDHWALSQSSGDRLRRGLLHLADTRVEYQNLVVDDRDEGQSSSPNRKDARRLPTYLLTHSLGGKLASLYIAATSQSFDGVGMMSFNNFGLSETVRMAQEFAKAMQQQSASSTASGESFDRSSQTVQDNVMEQMFSFAETVLGVMGIEFQPTPQQTYQVLRQKYATAFGQNTRLFSFEDDQLDNTKEFVEACQGDNDFQMATESLVSTLPGDHLTPVYVSFDLDDIFENGEGLDEDTKADLRDLAVNSMDGFQGASFGNRENLDRLVQEIAQWILYPDAGPSTTSNQTTLLLNANK
jgi:Protein of unknown function (DUF1350)